MLDHPGVTRALQLCPLIHLVKKPQEGLVHVERVIVVLLLPVDLGTPAREPFQACVRVAWDPLTHLVNPAGAVQLLDFNVIAGDVLHRRALDQIVRFGLATRRACENSSCSRASFWQRLSTQGGHTPTPYPLFSEILDGGSCRSRPGCYLHVSCPPTQMFTAPFDIARIAGWIAHWKEMIEDPMQRIGRPRQLYTGDSKRSYVSIEAR